MTNKEALDYIYTIAIFSSGEDEIDNKVRECYNIIAEALEENQKQKEILEILKPYFRGAVFPSAINFNFSDKNWKPIKEWLENENK